MLLTTRQLLTEVEPPPVDAQALLDRAVERALSDLLQAELALAGAIRMLPWMSCFSEEKQEITRPSQINQHRSEPNSGCNI